MVSRTGFSRSRRPVKVLNAFRRHGWFHIARTPHHEPASYSCSTPFGVMDGFTFHVMACCCGGVGCSTPFGVMDGFTKCRWARQCGRNGAQRLSASWMVSHDGVRLQPVRRLVLNAFRRHGWFHTIGESRLPWFAGAQRLSASWMVSLSPASVTARGQPLCSTPFGVMDGFTLRQVATSASCSRVLNAFRRHGWFHRRCGGTFSRGSRPGAQRLSASWMVSLRAGQARRGSHIACSTPFGVMDGFTTYRVHVDTGR